MLPVEVAFVSYDARTNLAVVFLRELHPSEESAGAQQEEAAEGAAEGAGDVEESQRRLLPIWIGLPEAQAIYTRLEGKEPPRPLTHDLLKNVLTALDAELARVEVHSIQEMVFHGRLCIDHGGGRLEIDARPSDAIALALRAEAPIFVDKVLMESAAMKESDIRQVDRESLRERLKDLDEEDYVRV